MNSLLANNYDAFVDGVNRCGTDYVELAISYGDKFVNIIDKYPQYSDDIIELIRQRCRFDDYFIERLIEEGAKGTAAVAAFVERCSRFGEYNRSTLNEGQSINRQIEKILQGYSYSLDDFKKLMLKDIAQYTPSEIAFMKEVRESIPMPTESTLMSKVLPYDKKDDYLTGNFKTIGGFVTKVEDVAMCKSYDDYYSNLRLDYNPPQYFPATDEALIVIRYYTKEANMIRIPYSSKAKGWGGFCTEDPPFKGNGFTDSTNGLVIPEYKYYDIVNDNAVYCSIENGAEMYIVTKSGEEILWAIYKADAVNPKSGKGIFVRLEDIK